MSTSMRTPLGRVLGFGAAHEGTGHFWRQRLTALANVPLLIALVLILVSAAGRPYPEVVALLSSPLISIILLLAVFSVAIHMRIGMQVIIEDYIHGPAARPLLVILNSFFTITVAAIAAFAILKLALGGA
jgi:succinate dehydrogenase / fumarate reductase membrane anchor subunit